MGQKMRGIMISSVKSGSGKTMVTCALLKALKEMGEKPCAFKCGPDYIDPMFHREVIGVSSHNLDSFFSTEPQLHEIYCKGMEDRGISVTEGAMGLFDGLGGVNEEGSAYHIASILKLPIVLVVDAHGMGRSILPVLQGFLTYDREKLIAGVILNQISENFYERLKKVIEKELDLPVLGFLPKRKEFSLESRHLGLKLPGEISNLREKVGVMADELKKCVSIDKIMEIADAQEREQPREHVSETYGTEHIFGQNQLATSSGSSDRNYKKKRVRIGVAKDEAFCFYYEENLRLLEENGAELVFFSPLHDGELPEGLDGILLGGGYPEVYAKQLEGNKTMRTSVKNAIENGMPSLAECGGFLYLHSQLEDDKGNVFQMCGVLSGKCVYKGRLARFGYVELEEKREDFLKKGSSIKGHEFHYYDSDDNGCSFTARKPTTEEQWNCIHGGENYLWGFPHFYYCSNPDFIVKFIEKAELFQNYDNNGGGHSV